MNILSFIDPSVSGLTWVIAISLFVILVDIFFETKILTVLALLGVSVYFSLLFDISTKGYNEVDATGEEGVYRVIEDKRFIYWNGDLWEVKAHEHEDFSDGQTVLITSSENGKFTIEQK